MTLWPQYIFLIFEIVLLVLKYIILKYSMTFSAYVSHGKFKKKEINKKLTVVQIVRFSNKIFKIIRISSCLIKSMTVKELLANRGYKSNLVIGIKNEANFFESHCWLEIQGELYTHNKNISKFKVIKKI